MGYEVVTASDGQEALDIFQSETGKGNSFKAMLFDLTVPGAMGGKEAIEHLRKIDKDIPVFVASGYASEDILANPGAHDGGASAGQSDIAVLP